MSDFATVADMAQRTQGALTAVTHSFLPQELAAATALIRDECGWHIAGRETRTVRTRGAFVRDVWLPAMEIEAVTAATVDGQVIDLATVEFDRDTGWTNLRGSSWEVTYEAGFVTVPAVLVSLTLQVAARALGSPLGVTREQIGQHSVSFTLTGTQSAGGTVLLPHEKAQLAPYVLGTLP